MFLPDHGVTHLTYRSIVITVASLWKITFDVCVGSCGAVACVLTVIGHLKHGKVVATLLLDLLRCLATSVIFVAAPEVVPVNVIERVQLKA